MSGPQVLLLTLAGLGAGLVGSVAGLASLISYPALLGIGLPPVTANVTNTVALVFSGVGSALGSQPELRRQSARLRRLGIAGILGGVVGGVLLLITPPDAFELTVPWLIAFTSATILVQPRPQVLQQPHHSGDAPALTVGVFLIAIYAGYFGAAAGVLLLAVLLTSTAETLARNNAMKNATLGLANGVAALTFVIFGPVYWSAVVPLALGFLAGGLLGPVLVRHTPAGVLRVVIALAGFAVAVHLGLEAYG